MKYFYTKEIKEQFKEQIQNITKTSNLKTLDIVQIGDNLSSTKYVNLKQKIGHKLGIRVNLYKYSLDVELAEIKKELISKNKTVEKAGLIIQLPIPDSFMHLLEDREIWEDKFDVDSLTSFTQNLNSSIDTLPPTIQGIDIVIRTAFVKQEFNLENLATRINLRGVTVSVIGQGKLVGGFMLNYLRAREATIISINQYSQNLIDLIQNCDIIITATGQKALIKSSMINPQKTKLLIDVGSSEQKGSIFGDLDYEDFEQNSHLFPNLIICPSKGGVGPLTVLSLFWNLIRAG